MKKALLMVSLVALSCTAADNLQALVDAAVKAGRTKLVLEPKVYELESTLRLRKLTDFTLDGNGAELVVKQNCIGIEVAECSGVTLRNFSIDYRPLVVTQGTVIAAEAGNVCIRLHEGYPDVPRLERLNLHLFNASDRLWKRGVPELFGSRLEKTETPREYLVRHEGARYAVIGDLVAIDWRTNNTIKIQRTERFTLEECTIYASPGIAILGRFTTGKHTFRRVTIGRNPALPAGAVEPRLLSAAADALNYAYCETGPDILDCDFSFQGDDSVNFHSVAFPVIKVESPTSFLVVRPYPTESFPFVAKAGMRLRVLRAGDFSVCAEGEITALKLTREVADEGTVRKLFRHYRPERDPRRTVYRIELMEPLEIAEGSFVDIPALSGAGFVISGNYFHDHRARGIRMMASDGVIENNRFERIKQNAVTIGGEYGYWREAGWAENVTVRNNRISDVGTGMLLQAAASYAPGAIALIVRPEPGVTAVASGNRNIIIEDNRIDGCPVPGILLHAVDGARVKGNVISNVCTVDLSKAGRDYGFRVSKPIEITPSAINVIVE